MANNALSFNGTSSYVDINNKNNFKLTQFTVEAWINTTSLTAQQTIFSTHYYKAPGVYYGFVIELLSGCIRFSTLNGGAWATSNSITSSTLTANIFTHVACTFDGTTGTIYINGVKNISGALPIPTYDSTTMICSVGCINNGVGTYGKYFSGVIDEVRVWNVARGQSDIQANYNKVIFKPLPSSLIGYWRLDEGIGTTTNDLTSNNNTGTLSNCTWVTGCSNILYNLYLISDKNSILRTLDGTGRLMANYKFNETSGTICTDSKGVYNGAYSGTTSVTEGGQTFRRFNGTSDYIQFTNRVIPLGKKSIKFNIKVDSPPSDYQYILGESNTDTSYGVLFQLNPTGHIEVLGCNNTNYNGLFNVLNSTNLITDGAWHTILFVWDGDIGVGNAKLFIDDMSMPDDISDGIDTEKQISSYNFTIGKSSRPDWTGYFKGDLDGIEIYDDVVHFDASGNRIINLIDSPSQTLDEDNYLTNGFNDVTQIPVDQLKALGNLSDFKLLMYTDDLSKEEAKLVGECDPFDLTHWLKDNECSLKMWTDDTAKTEATMEYELLNPYRPIDVLKTVDSGKFDVLMKEI